ncbi:MAG TPA: hypothetical protein VHN77_15440 [Phycisphaerales bacterium]|nr:hypothetical protein [Phycisphaerales bacterium]
MNRVCMAVMVACSAQLCSASPRHESQGIRDYHIWNTAVASDNVLPDVDAQMNPYAGGGAGPTTTPVAASPETKQKTDQQVDPVGGHNPAWDKLLLDDPAVVAEYKSLMIARWQRDRTALVERTAAFQWQYDSTKWMFLMVHIFLLVAMAAAIMEFLAAYRKRKEAPTPTEVAQQRSARLNLAREADVELAKVRGTTTALLNSAPAPNTAQESAKEPETELKLGMEGLALKTALHGVLILAMAMGFYFLYLRYVYPITEISPRAQQSTQAAGASK